MNKELRKALCKEPIVDSEGNINHLYFADLPKNYWSLEDQQKLLMGLQEKGVGKFEEIQAEYFPSKTAIELRLRTCLVLGVYDLSEYEGFTDTSQIPEIYSKNQDLGQKSGKWYYGVYLNN